MQIRGTYEQNVIVDTTIEELADTLLLSVKRHNNTDQVWCLMTQELKEQSGSLVPVGNMVSYIYKEDRKSDDPTPENGTYGDLGIPTKEQLDAITLVTLVKNHVKSVDKEGW